MKKLFEVIKYLRHTLEQFAVDTILTSVGIIATYLSVKYTYEWQVYTGDNKFDALLYSLVIVGFSIVVFEFAVLAAKAKHKYAAWFFIAWLIVAAYSMQSTVAGQYIGVQERKQEQYAEEANAAADADKRDIINKQLESIKEQRTRLLARNVQLLSILDKVQSAEDRKRLGSAVVSVEKEYKESQSKLSSLDDEERLLLLQQMGQSRGTATTGKRNVFQFYTAVLGVKNPDSVEFILAVFKGIILDSVNILCFMFVMLRRGRKEESLVEVVQGQEEEEEVQSEPKSPLELLIDEAYKEGRKSKLFPGSKIASTMGISYEQYVTIVTKLVRLGSLIQRKKRIYLNAYLGKEELLRDALTAGL